MGRPVPEIPNRHHTSERHASMSDVVAVEGIGEVYGKKLKEAGIATSRSLLAQGASRSGRKKIEDTTGISVTYTDDVSDNVEFFGKVVNQLGSCQTVKRDLFVLTDWMAARMVGEG